MGEGDHQKAGRRSVTGSSVDILYQLAAINGTRLFYEMPYQLARAFRTLVACDNLYPRHQQKFYERAGRKAGRA